MTYFEKEQLEKTSKEFIEMGESLNRLNNNEDFKLIINNFLEKEPVRLVHLLADPVINMSENAVQQRKEIEETLIGISRFSAYLRNIPLLAERAKHQLEELTKTEIEYENN